ncbi:polygalacturonase-like [Syzygium oleosum]|uniref:polygalacturonase-like n=1 Tax=Syzygium oleosum TaxID=219896 RepID=UPI0011D23679|nr:polygalacturonase-like [Syzygium oleosum]
MSSSIDVHRLWLLVSVIFIILNGPGNLAVAFNDRKGLGSDTKSLLVKNQESFSRLHMMRRLASTSTTKVVNVDNYGAKGDGGDDSEAFKKAWNVACSSERAAIVVPKNRIYHLKPITFSGPCKSGLTFKVYGTIKASVRLSDYDKDRRYWLMFDNLTDFRMEGGGFINGNGRKWWANSCKINKSLPCKTAPTAMTFYECKNLRVADLIIQNAQQMHLSFQKCVNVKVLNLLVSAPEKSPNTDGIHVTGTQNILIKNCVIRTGDDCISIVSGSKNVQATDIVCGPGHGISIGSLGADKSTDYVSNVLVNRARLSGTTNGVRIKTWQGGSGYAKNIIFQNISMRNVTNPIIIDQNYCDQAEACPEQASAVQVSNVVYKNIKGTSASEVAINFDCSKSHPCRGILLQNVGLVSNSGESAKASSSNVRYTKMGDVYP